MVLLNSAFRNYNEQKYLFEGFQHHLPGFNKAARPGASEHQSGVAFDLAVSGGDGNPVYDWLKSNATTFGFIRTVNGEPWHWEFDSAAAAKAKKSGTYKIPGIS